MERRSITKFEDFINTEYVIYPHSDNTNPLNYIKVNNCDIDFELNLNYLKNFRFIKFENCIFLKRLIIENIGVKDSFDFTDCTFKENVSLKNLKIGGKSRFWESVFESYVEFSNVRFSDLADFFKASFSEIIIFYKVDFLGTTVFTSTNFKKNVLFTYSKIADVIIFTRTKFDAGLDLSQAIITGKINFQNSDFQNFIAVADINDDNDYRESFEINGLITLNNKRETFRILKQVSKDNANQFKYLEYAKLENEVYYKQLKKDWYKRFDNFFIFLLNKISNNHNMNWSLGVAFTGIFGFIFFYFSILSTDCISFGFDGDLFNEYLGRYFIFLSPLHDIDMFEKLKPNTSTIIYDFFGRIFVGYGIYQTIQAFRKHKG